MGNHADERPPHPATLAQQRAQPHAATLAQRRLAHHAAKVAQQQRAQPHAATAGPRRTEPHPAIVMHPSRHPAVGDAARWLQRAAKAPSDGGNALAGDFKDRAPAAPAGKPDTKAEDTNEHQLSESTYGQGYSRFAAHFRQGNKGVVFARNVATFMLVEKESTKRVPITLASDSKMLDVVLSSAKHGTAKGHSEQVIIQHLRQGYKGASLKTHWIEWIYTERKVCRPYAMNTNPHGYDDCCLTAISKLIVEQREAGGPGIQIYYTLPPSSNAAATLQSMVQKLSSEVKLADNAADNVMAELDFKRDAAASKRLRRSGVVDVDAKMAAAGPPNEVELLERELKAVQGAIKSATKLSPLWWDLMEQADELFERIRELRDY